MVCGAFRVGIEVVADGLPSIARDSDGTIDANRNFVLAQGSGWIGAATLGITGDWVIRADVSFDPPFTSEVRNDGFVDGGSAVFQPGFVAGEIGAVRLVPSLGPVTVERVRFLFGGDEVSRNIVMHIWDDSAEALPPGAELYSGIHSVVGFDTTLQEIDLSGESIVVTGPFRVGIEFATAGLPSIARDTDDSIDASRNFVFVPGFGWTGAPTLGLTGDWVIRAVVVPEPDGAAVAGLVALGWIARRRCASAL